ncbi:MAG: hypothetical protein RI967_752 [Planctomycetota bacterium]
MLTALRFILKAFLAIVGLVLALALTVGLFLLLPLLESITSTNDSDTIIQAVDTAVTPPPPPPPEPEEPEKEEEPEEPEPPKLAEEAPPLDLSQLELALNPGMGGGGVADFAVKLPVGAAGGGDSEGGVDALFSLSDLDQKPRAIYQPGPSMTPALKKKAPATVNIIFIVDQRGRVESPMVQSSTLPDFEAPALAAVKQWRFEPGKRNGEPVKFRMRVPITFPKK